MHYNWPSFEVEGGLRIGGGGGPRRLKIDTKEQQEHLRAPLVLATSNPVSD